MHVCVVAVAWLTPLRFASSFSSVQVGSSLSLASLYFLRCRRQGGIPPLDILLSHILRSPVYPSSWPGMVAGVGSYADNKCWVLELHRQACSSSMTKEHFQLKAAA